MNKQSTSHLVIACGALAREIVALKRVNNWRHITVQCLPADLHNRPDRIPDAVRAKLEAAREQFTSIFVAYADCGTGGLLDKVIDEYAVERLPGAHCYQFYAGQALFDSLADSEPGTFYLTDFLVRHFDRLIWQGLGLAHHPDLLSSYFGNYRKLIYLAQLEQPGLIAQARIAAERLGLLFEYRLTGYGDMRQSLSGFAGKAA